MERGFDGDRRRRFDAHELYLLSIVFKVPLLYFFLPPPKTGAQELADSERPVSDLYAATLGREWELDDLDERLADLNVTNPEEVDQILAAMFGAENAADNWHDHFRTWRKKRLDFLAEFALQIKSFGPKAYLQSKAHRRGEEAFDNFEDTED